jgi:hypothetical protein
MIRSMTRIEGYEIAPDADAEFLASAPVSGLYRALRADVPLRFVRVEAAADAPSGAAPLYETAYEDGEPDGVGGAVLIWPFEVPDGAEERLVAAWERVHELLATRQGRLGTRLYRSVDSGRFRFVAVVRWSSPLMYARALREPAIGAAIAALPFAGRPAMYLAVDH